MKFTIIFLLVFVAVFALAAPDGQERRQGAYTASALVLCLLARVDIFATKVLSLVNSIVGAVTGEGESSLSDTFPTYIPI